MIPNTIEVDENLKNAILEVIQKRNPIPETIEVNEDLKNAILEVIQKRNKRPEAEVAEPMVDFEVFGNEEEEILEEEPSTVIPYNDALSTVKEPERPAFEDEITSLREKGIHVADARDIDLDHTLYRDQFFIPTTDEKDEVVEEVKEALNNTPAEENKDIKTIRKVYISFQMRVLLLTIGVILLFGSACYIIVSTLQNNNIRKVGLVMMCVKRLRIHTMKCV